MFLSAAAAAWLAVSPVAYADPADTREALDRTEELLTLRREDGLLPRSAVMPLIVVSATPRYTASEEWFATRTLEVLQTAFGAGGLRWCAACTVPRTYVEDGRMVYQAGPTDLAEVARLDDRTRGDAPPAKAAAWVTETVSGVSVRIVDLSTGRVLFAQNIDPNLAELQRTATMYSYAAELERRARGDSLTQAFVDVALVPGQHVSLDWTDQWGRENRNMSGVTLSAFDPIVGIGANHHRVTRLFHTSVGVKAILSLPTAVVQSVGQDGEVLDPLVTVAGIARVPFGRSNYGGLIAVSTNGEVGIGISLLNVSFLPFLP